MAEVLAEQINAMTHVQEEIQSSYESVLFVHGIMSAFYDDLNVTAHTRRAQMKTMTTEAGIEARKIVLLMHDSLAKSIQWQLKRYSDVASQAQTRLKLISQSLHEAEHSMLSYGQLKQFIKSKTERMDLELLRLAQANYKVSKQLHLGKLKDHYGCEEVKFHSKSESNLGLDLQRIRAKAETYQREHNELIGYLEQNLNKELEKVMVQINSLTGLQKQALNFDSIYEIFQSQANWIQAIDIKAEVRNPIARPSNGTWKELFSLSSAKGRAAEEEQEMLIK